MPDIDSFFQAIDRGWQGPREGRIRLRVLGSVALMLQSDYERGTNDGDILETAGVTGPIKELLLALAGKGTRLAERHGMYLDIVANGLPFLPLGPRWHARSELNETLTTFEVDVLDVVDVVVTKMKRFHAADRSDVQAMVDRELVPHDRLVARFRDAVDGFRGDARAEDLPRYVRNLHQVERDMFGVPATEIELPDWI